MTRMSSPHAVFFFLVLLAGCDSGGTSATDNAGGNTGGSAGAGGEGGEGGNNSLPALDDCKAACSKVDALACPQNTAGDCDKLCESSSKASACSGEFAAYSACAKSADWACDGGLAKVSGCDKEQNALVICLNQKGSGSGTPGTPGNFFCNETTCDGSSNQRACCLKLDLSKGGIDAKCVASIDQCGEDSRWECDGPDDCGGRPCCWSNPSSGSGQIVLGYCRDACKPFAGEREVCQDTCTGGLYCCKKPGEDLGNCEQSKEICDSKANENP